MPIEEKADVPIARDLGHALDRAHRGLDDRLGAEARGHAHEVAQLAVGTDRDGGGLGAADVDAEPHGTATGARASSAEASAASTNAMTASPSRRDAPKVAMSA